MDNKRDVFIAQWKEYLRDIDPEHIEVYTKGDDEFPNRKFLDQKVTPNVYNLDHSSGDITIFVRLKGNHFGTLGSQIYFCDGAVAFGNSSEFIDQEGGDNYLRSSTALTWNKMYHEIIEYTNAYRSMIPAPPKKVYY